MSCHWTTREGLPETNLTRGRHTGTGTFRSRSADGREESEVLAALDRRRDRTVGSGDPRLAYTADLDGNTLLTFRPGPYYSGTGWDRGGDFKTMADFDAHVNAFMARLSSPVTVQVVPR